MSAVAALTVTTSVYAGFQLTVRPVVYPQFARVPADAFGPTTLRTNVWSRSSSGPLFAAVAVTTLLARVTSLGLASIAAAVCFAAILGFTAFGAVPQHRRLSAGFDAAALRSLLQVDTPACCSHWPTWAVPSVLDPVVSRDIVDTFVSGHR